jgi:predicted dehydrogenase
MAYPLWPFPAYRIQTIQSHKRNGAIMNNQQSKVRLGVIGLGNMGAGHLAYLPGVGDAVVTAICDVDPARVQKYAAAHNVPGFASVDELLGARVCDAVLIATPHYDHPRVGMAALQQGYHVLCEKPIAVGVKAARELIDISKKHPAQIFGIMYNQRTNPMYQKLRELVRDGELGDITRVTWLVTDWFRTWAYYASGGWRATWAGEGGGVLINQCPHNLDLLQWIIGMMPSRVTAVGFIGKRHPIEVEDEMSAILEYPNGAIGHFITTTGEAPGTNRLEIVGDLGKIVAEGGKLILYRNRKSTREVNQHSAELFPTIENWRIDIPVGHPAPGGEHERITRNFIKAIQTGAELIAPGAEAVYGLEMGNAMLMSAMTRTPVDLPVDAEAYDQLINDLAHQHTQKQR